MKNKLWHLEVPTKKFKSSVAVTMPHAKTVVDTVWPGEGFYLYPDLKSWANDEE